MSVPVVVQASPNTYGPDGKWNAVRVYFEPDQPIDLLPWETGRTDLLNSTYCANVPGTCYAARAGLYDQPQDDSSVALPYKLDPWSQLSMSTLFFESNTAGSKSVHVANQSLKVTSRSSSQYPSGLVDDRIGSLDIGSCAVTNTYKGQFLGNSPPSYLSQTGIISSASVHLQIGSASQGIPMSMMYGGYDAARIIGSTIIQEVGLSSLLSLTLNDIGIKTAWGDSPFPNGDQSGLLGKGNDTIASSKNGYAVFVSLHTPYLQFPPSVCTAIAENLPVSYDPDVGLYLWNTDDAQYVRVLSAASYLSFDLSNNFDQITINVPFQLLNLTLEDPLKDKPTQYFPCNPLSSHNDNLGWFNEANGIGSPTLGRAFLQAASLGINWTPNNSTNCNSSRFWLAQAPGPRFSSPTLTPLIGNAINVRGVDTPWESTWEGFWPPHPGSSDHRLFKDSKVGLGVGLGLGGVLLFLLGAYILFVLRNRSRRIASGEKSIGSDGFLCERGLPAELTGRSTPPELLDELKDRVQMDEQRCVCEVEHVLETHELEG